MIDIDKIFVVIDPTRENQTALQRAAHIARIRNAGLHAYTCVWSAADNDNVEVLRQVEMDRYRLWLEHLVAPVRATGIAVELELEWGQDWRAAVSRAVKRSDCGLIVKHSRSSSQSRRRLLASAEAQLFSAARCPVMLVKRDSYHDKHVILMAVDINHHSSKYQQVLDSVITCGNTCIAAHPGGELHVVNAYAGSDDYVHVTDVVKRTGLPLERVHVVGGTPEQAVAKVARMIGAEAIILGLSTNSVVANRVFGNTAENLLRILDQDILVVIPGCQGQAGQLYHAA